jgi:hypothetical protein
MLMEELVSVTLYDSNGDGVFDFDEFIRLVSDLLCLRDGVLLAPPQAVRNLAVVLAKKIPGPPRDTIEVAHLVELDGRWASLITQPDVMAAGGAGLRSLSDQRLHRDLEDLHARRQAELVSGAGFGTTPRPRPPPRPWLNRLGRGSRDPRSETMPPKRKNKPILALLALAAKETQDSTGGVEKKEPKAGVTGFLKFHTERRPTLKAEQPDLKLAEVRLTVVPHAPSRLP